MDRRCVGTRGGGVDDAEALREARVTSMEGRALSRPIILGRHASARLGAGFDRPSNDPEAAYDSRQLCYFNGGSLRIWKARIC